MLRLLKLIKREFVYLYGTMILISIILTIFCAAFLSVVAVWHDVPLGIYNYATVKLGRRAVSVPDISISEARELGGTWAYGTKRGLTTDVTITGKQSIAIDVFETPGNPFPVTSSTWRTYAITPQDAPKLSQAYGKYLSAGSRWFETPGEMIMTTDFAKSLGIYKTGEQVLFGDRPFTVVGLITSGSGYSISLNADKLPPICALYICVEEDEPMDFCYLLHDTAKQLRTTYEQLKRAGYDVGLSSSMANVFGNVDLCFAFFGSVAILLGIMVMFILYSLIAIFYRQRRAQICRYKLLGATGGLIASVYCIIALAMALVSSATGAALSILFNKFFMALCTDLFEQPFTPHFYPSVPFMMFAGMAAFILLLYFRFNRKIKNTHIAQEVKHE